MQFTGEGMVRPLKMLVPALLLLSLSGSQALDVREIDRLAQARDVKGLEKFVDGEAPLSVLRTNGAYEAGRFGWHAVELNALSGNRYIVLTTPLTGEDVGELLFHVSLENRLRYIPESDPFGMKILREDLTADFDLPQSVAKFVARVDLAMLPPVGTPGIAGPLLPRQGFILRLGPNFKVSGVNGPDGKAAPFAQAGGIVFVDVPRASGTYTLTYSGILHRPQYAGSIDAEHIQLTNEFWYPSIARGPAPYTLSAKVPDNWIAVGQGERKEVEGRTLFSMRLPTSVWSFSAEPFKTFSRTDKNGRGYDVYSRRLTEAQMRLQTELFEPILAFYERSFAPYPFARWGAADVKSYGGGALEAYNFATYGIGFIPSEDAHEPSHTWWGGIMPNTYLKSFWNESFAVWSEGLYLRNVPIGNVAARREAFADLAEAQGSYNRVPISSGSAFIGPDAGALGYGKGGHVLAMLEQLLGTDRMLEGCREWIKGHPKGEPAEWEEFEVTMLRLYPTLDLKSFFDDWLRKPGVADVQVKSLKWEGNQLAGTMNPSPWRMPLEFVLVSPTGTFERRMLDTRTVAADGSFALSSGIGKPARVLFDPYHLALRRGSVAPETGFFSAIRGFKVYRDAAVPNYLELRGAKVTELPSDLDRVVLIGHPRTTPAMTPLLAKLGMTVAGDTLTWRGTSIDLRQAGAVAIVDLGGGKRCALALGTTSEQPNVGRASVALFDPLGRFLNGVTPLPQPKDGVFEIE